MKSADKDSRLLAEAYQNMQKSIHESSGENIQDSVLNLLDTYNDQTGLMDEFMGALGEETIDSVIDRQIRNSQGNADVTRIRDNIINELKSLSSSKVKNKNIASDAMVDLDKEVHNALDHFDLEEYKAELGNEVVNDTFDKIISNEYLSGNVDAIDIAHKLNQKLKGLYKQSRDGNG